MTNTIVFVIFSFAALIAIANIFVLLIRALKKYVNSNEAKQERQE